MASFAISHFVTGIGCYNRRLYHLEDWLEEGTRRARCEENGNILGVPEQSSHQHPRRWWSTLENSRISVGAERSFESRCCLYTSEYNLRHWKQFYGRLTADGLLVSGIEVFLVDIRLAHRAESRGYKLSLLGSYQPY